MKWTTLEDISTLISKGTTPTTLGHRFVPEGIPFLRAEDVVGTAINPKSVAFCISEETDKLLSRSRLQAGDLLITIAGTLGRIGFVPMNAPPLNCNQAVAFVRLKSQVIDLLYACFACQAQIVNLLTLQKIGTIGNLNLEQVRQFQIPLPPLCEQKRIGALLSRADRMCRTRQYALELTDSVIRAIFLELFGDPKTNPKGWDMGTIEDVVSFSQYGTSQKSNSAGCGYPILGMGNITNWGTIDLSTLAYVELSKIEFENLALQRGDIIFNRTNSTELVGKTTFWNLDMGAVLASYLVRLRLKPEVMPEFFSALLNTGYFKNLFRDRCKKAVGQSNISPTLLKEFPAFVPPLPLQQKFAALVERVGRLRSVQREALRQAEHLFQSLLHDAFGTEATHAESKAHHV